MFRKIYGTRLKYYIRTKEFVFWILMFPIILTTLFKVGFAKLMDSEKFDTIDIVYCEDEKSTYEYKDIFKMVISNMSESSGYKMFNIIETDMDSATGLLKADKADACIHIGDKPEVIIAGNGIDQTMTKEITDIIIKKIALSGQIYQKTGNVPKDISTEAGAYITQKKADRNEPDATATYYFAALAMTCLFGALMGVYEIINIQADLSPVALRNSIAPVSKWTQLTAGYSAAGTVLIFLAVIVLSYIRWVLKINFGDRNIYVFVTTIIGCLTGLSIGMVISAVVKKGENVKVGIVTSFIIMCSFLAGLMISDMKYVMHIKAPLLDMINPASRITDAYYKLYYYDSLSGFRTDICILIIFIIISMVVTGMTVRRQQYDSI